MIYIAEAKLVHKISMTNYPSPFEFLKLAEFRKLVSQHANLQFSYVVWFGFFEKI